MQSLMIFAETATAASDYHQRGLVAAVVVGLLVKLAMSVYMTSGKRVSCDCLEEGKDYQYREFYDTFVDVIRPLWSWSRQTWAYWFMSLASILFLPMVLALLAYEVGSQSPNMAVTAWMLICSWTASLVFWGLGVSLFPEDDRRYY